jgi:hypothetical protein
VTRARSQKGSSSLRRTIERVRAAFDPDALVRICALEDFGDYAPRTVLPGRGRYFHHRDNGSDLLAVAHLDSVQRDRGCAVVDTAGGKLALSGVLDDRLGAYVILDLLPRLGVVADWLLTTDEESGDSTAAEFDTDKRYHWMFQFDRGGTDVVMYDYETEELVRLVESAGAKVGLGSFSDICFLDHLGCAGFNWGVGYRDYHSPRAHAWLEDTFTMVARFLRFHASNATTAFTHTPGPRFADMAFGFPDDCPDCASPLTDDGLCPVCDEEWLRPRARSAVRRGVDALVARCDSA